MKQQLLSLALALLTPVLLMAQPTITKDWIGSTGDFATTQESQNIPDVTPSGEGVTWDFTGLQTVDSLITGSIYVNPDTTQFKSMFQDANRCQFASFVDPDAGNVAGYSYSEVTDNIFVDHGQAIASQGFGNVFRKYTDDQTLMVFPFEYENSAADTYEGTFDLGIVTSYFTGETNFRAESWGRVNMPGGTFDDCMRVLYVVEEVDSTDLGLGIIEKTHTKTRRYVWLHPSHPGPLAQYETSEFFSVAIVNPLPPDTSATEFDTTFSWDVTAVEAGAKFFQPETFDVSIAPNPFNEYVQITYNLDRPESIQLEIQTIAGQTVYRSELSGVSGVNQESIDLGHLTQGTYIAVLKGNDKGTATQLIKTN